MNKTTQPAIFLSCGTPHNGKQEAFVKAVEAYLKLQGCKPQTVGRSAYSIRQPVERSRDLIGSCHGAVVMAFERTRVLAALGKPGSEKQEYLRDERHPSVWNQMEVAMAYAQKVPILLLVEVV